MEFILGLRFGSLANLSVFLLQVKMVMPGDNVTVKVNLISPLAMNQVLF